MKIWWLTMKTKWNIYKFMQLLILPYKSRDSKIFSLWSFINYYQISCLWHYIGTTKIRISGKVLIMVCHKMAGHFLWGKFFPAQRRSLLWWTAWLSTKAPTRKRISRKNREHTIHRKCRKSGYLKGGVYITCRTIKHPENFIPYSSREAAVNDGYVACKVCHP